MKPISKPVLKTHATTQSYITGFILSLALTLTAYIFVSAHVHSEHNSYPHSILIPLIIGLAVVQLITQLVFFLHLGKESKPRYNLLAFGFMLLVLGIVVLGSLWIMNNLNYHMSPADMDHYIINDEGIH